MVFIALLLLQLFLFGLAPAQIIQSGEDIQQAIDSAQEGDVIAVGPGTYRSIYVDRPLTIIGKGRPVINATLQNPAIVVRSDGVTIDGFDIHGVGKDTTAKFEYYMKNREAASGRRLDDPNSAILVEGSRFALINSTIYGAQAGIYALDGQGLTLKNSTLNGCDTGLFFNRGRSLIVSGCSIINCRKYGLDIEWSSDIVVDNNSIVNNANSGILLREGTGAAFDDNLISNCTFGLSLWNATFNQVRRNRVDHNYYGILVTNWSSYNNLTDNLLIDNSRGEITAGFGIGLSLQENSSHNLVIGNTAQGNYNGLEISKGCEKNGVYGNNARENKHGIRMNENRNNLIFGNNFLDNTINAYENTSQNIWNTTTGNYYSDYPGLDLNEDGMGDVPYSLPGPESKSFDLMPLIRPFGEGEEDLGFLEIRELIERYATIEPEKEDEAAARLEDGVMVISSPRRNIPPQWSDSKSFDVSRSPFQEEIDF